MNIWLLSIIITVIWYESHLNGCQYPNSLMNLCTRDGGRRVCEWERFLLSSSSGVYVLLILSKCVRIVCWTKAVFTCYATLRFEHFAHSLSECVCVYFTLNVFGYAFEFPYISSIIFNVKCQSTFNWLNITINTDIVYVPCAYACLFVYVTMYKLCSHRT